MTGRKSQKRKNETKEILSGPTPSEEAFYDDDPTVGNDGQITNFPPKYDDISSRWVILILRANWTAGKRNEWYPRVFTSKNLRSDWENKGTAGKELVDNVWRYQVAFGNRQLHGAEGIQSEDVLDREATHGTKITLGDPADDQKPPSKANTRKYLAKAAAKLPEFPNQDETPKQQRQSRKRKNSTSSIDTYASPYPKRKTTEPKHSPQTPEAGSSRTTKPTRPPKPDLIRPSDPQSSRLPVPTPQYLPSPNPSTQPSSGNTIQRNIEGFIFISDSEKEEKPHLNLKERLERQTNVAKKGLDALATIATICKTGQDPAFHQVGMEYRALYKSLAAEHNQLLVQAVKSRPFNQRKKGRNTDRFGERAGVRGNNWSYQKSARFEQRPS